MKMLNKLWGLIYDDPRLTGTVVLFLIIAAILRLTHLDFLAAIAIWAGLVIAVVFAIEYELRKKLRHK